MVAVGLLLRPLVTSDTVRFPGFPFPLFLLAGFVAPPGLVVVVQYLRHISFFLHIKSRGAEERLCPFLSPFHLCKTPVYRSMLAGVPCPFLFPQLQSESQFNSTDILEKTIVSFDLLCVPPNLTNFPCISKCGLFSVGVVASDSPYPVSLSAPLCSMRLSSTLLLPSWS